MNQERSVVIGCDDTHLLSTIIGSLQEKYPVPMNLISAMRQPDLINLSRTFNPALAILSFKDNLAAIRNFEFYVNRPEIPILCLTHSTENETLFLSETNILFTFPLHHIEHKEYFSSRIRSIFQLRSAPPHGFAKNTMPETDPSSDGYERNLSRYVMELEQKKEVLLKIKDRLVELYPSVDELVRTELVSLANSIKLTYMDNRIWDDFKVYFEKTDPRFLTTLSRKHPSLTSKDIKYCCYLKMNMSNDDIRDLLGINQESVRTHKYRLKKKMALGREQDLAEYVRSVGTTVPGLSLV